MLSQSNSRIPLLKKFINAKGALIIGIGGAGDILGTFPTMFFLKSLGVKTVIGSIAWERIVIDPKPGPRSFDEFEGIEIISSSLCLAGEEVKMKHGPIPQAAYVSKILGEKVALIDMTKSKREIAKGIKEAMNKLDLDLFIAIDVGGDVLAKGEEEDLRSPLADSFMLSSLSHLEEPILGVFGIGCDGELRREEVELRISQVAEIKGYLGAIGIFEEALEMMSKAAKLMKSEASKLPIEAANGLRGIVPIREGTRKAEVSIESTITYFLDLKKAYEISPLAKALENVDNLDEANEVLHRLGLFTELDFEREAFKKGVRSYKEFFGKI